MNSVQNDSPPSMARAHAFWDQGLNLPTLFRFADLLAMRPQAFPFPPAPAPEQLADPYWAEALAGMREFENRLLQSHDALGRKHFLTAQAVYYTVAIMESTMVKLNMIEIALNDPRRESSFITRSRAIADAKRYYAEVLVEKKKRLELMLAALSTSITNIAEGLMQLLEIDHQAVSFLSAGPVVANAHETLVVKQRLQDVFANADRYAATIDGAARLVAQVESELNDAVPTFKQFVYGSDTEYVVRIDPELASEHEEPNAWLDWCIMFPEKTLPSFMRTKRRVCHA